MKYLLTFLLSLSLIFSCTSETSNKKEQTHTEKNTTVIKPENSSDNKLTPISKEASSNLLEKIEKVQTEICSGQLKVDDIYNYQLDGKSMGFYLQQNIMLLPKEDQDTYQNLKKKADCCLKAITQGSQCEYFSK